MASSPSGPSSPSLWSGRDAPGPGGPGSPGHFTLKETQSLLERHWSHVMASLSAEMSDLANGFEKNVRVALQKHQSDLIKISCSVDSLTSDLRRRGHQDTPLGPVVQSPAKPENGIGEDCGPQGNEGKCLPNARGDDPLPALPTVLEDEVAANSNSSSVMASFSYKGSLQSKGSRESNKALGSAYASSEALSPPVGSSNISPQSSMSYVDDGKQMSFRENNSVNLARVLAAGRKSQRQCSPDEKSMEQHQKIKTILGNIAEHSWLDCVMGVLVLLNSAAMAMELECIGNESGVTIEADVTWHCADSVIFPVLEHVFTWIFAVELALRAWATRCSYFKNLFNLGDTVLVILPVVDLYILAPLMGDTANIDILRLLRLGKLARAVRLMRTLRLFRGLRLLVQACSSFLPSLAWSMALLGICMMMGSLVMGNLLQEFIINPANPMESRVWVWTYYGTAYRAMWTMYEITMAGNWPTRARPILEDVDHRFMVFYAIYVTFIVFAVIRIITAVFLRETLEAANNDAELMVQERLLQNARYVKKLESIFSAMDDSGDGLLTEDEMTQLLMDPRVQAYLQSMDLDVNEGQALFQLLQNGEGMVTYDDFIDGILRCKGPARAIDQICLQCDVKNVAEALKTLVSSLEESKVIQGRRRRVKKTKVHKEDLLFLGTRAAGKGMSRQTSPV